MKHTDIKAIFAEPEKYIGQQITVCGWVRTSAEVKPMAFIQLNDGTTVTQNLQLTIHQEKMTEDEFRDRIRPLMTLGASLKATGIIVASERNIVELETTDLQLLGDCPADYPLQKKRASDEFLRTIPHLRSRTNKMKACMSIRSALAFAVHQYFHINGYTYIHTPIITDSDCEGAGEMFRITTQPWNAPQKTEQEYYESDFFGKKAGLSVSCQLEGEMAAVGGMGRIYTFGPTFRAEKSGTTRHVAEFWHVEPEVCFADIHDIIEIAEDFIKYIIRYAMDHCRDELAFCDKFLEKGLLDKLNNVVSSEFAKLDYTDAIDILQKSGQNFEYPVSWGCDLQSEHERYLTDVYFKKPVFLINYPKEIKSFYMKQNPDGKTVAATDLLVPGIGEIIGCSERETDLEKLTRVMVERGMPLENYSNYLDTRKYGSVEHSGFGLGFDRLTMYVTGIGNIRDVLQFPRTYKHIY